MSKDRKPSSSQPVPRKRRKRSHSKKGKGYVNVKVKRKNGFLHKKVIPFYRDRPVFCNIVAGSTLVVLFLALVLGALRGWESGNDGALEMQAYWLSEPFDADRILDAFVEKNFGPQGLESLNSVSLTGQISIGGESKPFNMVKKRPDLALLRIDLAPNVTATYGVNPSVVWFRLGASQREDSVNILEGEEEQSFRALGKFFTPLVELASSTSQRDTKVISIEIVSDDDRDLLKIEYRDDDFRYESFLTTEDLKEVRRLDYSSDESVRETVFSDYRDSQGILFPFLSKSSSELNDDQEVALEKVNVNPGIISSLFEAPSSGGGE